MRTRLAFMAVGVALGACNGKDLPAVVVHATPRATTRAIGTLNVTLGNAGATTTHSFDVGNEPLPLSFSVSPEGHSGQLTVDLAAVGTTDDPNTGASHGHGVATLSSDDIININVVMDPDDFVVNSQTSSTQYLTSSAEATGRQLTVLPDGTFFAAWENDCPVQRCDVFARRFTDDTLAARNDTSGDFGDLILNLDNTIFTEPAIDGSADGVVSAFLANNVNGLYDVHAVQLSSTGAHTGFGEIEVAIDAVPKDSPDVAMVGNGQFVVVWAQQVGGGDTTEQVWGRLYGSDGTPVINGVTGGTGEFPIATNGGVESRLPSVTRLADGTFVVVWTQQVVGLSEVDVMARHFDANAMPVSDVTYVTLYSNEAAATPHAAPAPNGGFVVVWELALSDQATRMSHPILGALVDSGMTVGPETTIRVATTPSVDTGAVPTVAILADGTIGVAWHDCGDVGGDGDGCGIRFQLLTAAGVPEGATVVVNTTTQGEQELPDVEGLEDSFLVIWTDFSMQPPDTDGKSIRARAIYPTGM